MSNQIINNILFKFPFHPLGSKGFILIKNKNNMANSVDSDETDRNKMSHLDLHCLHRSLFWPDGL